MTRTSERIIHFPILGGKTSEGIWPGIGGDSAWHWRTLPGIRENDLALANTTCIRGFGLASERTRPGIRGDSSWHWGTRPGVGEHDLAWGNTTWRGENNLHQGVRLCIRGFSVASGGSVQRECMFKSDKSAASIQARVRP